MIVTSTSIDWLPAGGGEGCVITGSGTDITFSGGTLGGNVAGTLRDLTTGMPFPIADFMVFAGAPALSFSLGELGPGPSNTDCAGLAMFDTCAVFAGSPFSLQLTPTGTSVALIASGTVSDGVGPDAVWSGAFTNPIAGRSPAEIQAIILADGSFTSTHSGDFTLTAVSIPEPGPFLLVGGGLMAIGTRRWRRSRS